MGQYAKAEPLYQRSLAIHEDKLGKDHPDVATSLNNLASLYEPWASTPRRSRSTKRSLEIREAKLGKDHPTWPRASTTWRPVRGHGPVRQGGAALPAQPRDQGSQARQGPPRRGHSLNNLAGLYQAMGQYAKAEPLYQARLEIKEAKLGKDHPDVATDPQQPGEPVPCHGPVRQGGAALPARLEIYEDKLGKDHPDVAATLNNLANLYQAMGQYAKAEPLYQRA